MPTIQVSQTYHGDIAPNGSSPAELGATWYDIVAGVLKILTSKTPYTWISVGGGGGGGETNTASNVGIAGVGVFKQKAGVNLEFKKVNAGSSKATITDDTVNNEVDIDIVEGNINHSNISGIGTKTHAVIDTHLDSISNPHSVTKGQVGLGNADNTADLNKPISTNTQTALDGKAATTHNQDASTINAGTFDGDRLPSISDTKKGGVPATGAPTGLYLKDDGSWAMPAGGGEAENIVRITADVTNNTTTFANVTGLSFAVAANKDYLFEAFIIFQSTATATGIGFGVNGPASPVALALETHIPISLVATTHGSARAYDIGTASAGVDTANANLLAKVEGIFRNGANAGNLIIRFKAETAATVKVMTGSILRWRLLN